MAISLYLNSSSPFHIEVLNGCSSLVQRFFADFSGRGTFARPGVGRPAEKTPAFACRARESGGEWQCARYLDFSFVFLARQASKTPCGRVALPPGAARHSKIGACFAKHRWRRLVDSYPPDPKNYSTPQSWTARLGRDLAMAAAATPRGRPQYAASRDEIAPSASGDRKPTQPPGSAQRALTARLGKSCLNNVNYSNVFPPKAGRAGLEGTAFTPGRRCLPALGIGLPGEKNGLCPRAKKILLEQFTLF